MARLLRSIQCKDGAILSAKTTILADPVKRDDFEQAADFLLLVAPANVPRQRNHNISAIKNNKRKTGEKDKDGASVRYYSKKEWWALSAEQREEIMAQREAKKSKKGEKNGGKGKISAIEQRIAALESQLEEKKQTIAALQSDSSTSSNNATLPPRATNNPLQPPAGFTQRGGGASS